MKIYNYDPLTGELIGESDAPIDPEETKLAGEEKYLVPANATALQPPADPEGACVLNEGEWTIVEDHRGEAFYDANGAQVTIDTLGPVPVGLTLDPPPPPPVTSAEVKAECRRRIFEVADIVTQANISAVAALYASFLPDDRTDEQTSHLAGHAAGLTWIDQMRGSVQPILTGGLDLADDANWPDCPPEVLALAARF